MTGLRGRFVSWIVLPVALLMPIAAFAQPERKTGPDLSEFKTVETAITTKISNTAGSKVASPGYLGVSVGLEGSTLVVSDVEENSPAAHAGLKIGDVLTKVDGEAVKSSEQFRSILQTKSGGEKVDLAIRREKEAMTLTAALIATSRVMQAGQRRGVMGVHVEDDNNGGAIVTSVTAGLPADKAGLKVGDVIRKIDGKALGDSVKFAVVVGNHKPGDSLTLLVKPKSEEKDKDVKVTLVAEAGFPAKGKGLKGGAMGWDRTPTAWKKPIYRLAIVGIEYPDVKHNAKITAGAWEESLFTSETYVNANATGQRVHGSLNDYYQEQSFGKLKVEGKFFNFVSVAKKRGEYAAANTGQGKTALLVEALDAFYKRDGKDALKGFDGIFFVYAGERVVTNRGGIYWPHKAFFTHHGERWPYFIVQEGGAKMCDISVICHEFGHMLGLPDLYARPENPGSEGVGVWCAMSNQVGGGKPQHFCAWAKEQLGWITPAVIDPTVKQKLILSPIETSPKECFKVLARPDGGEYFLLENRKKKGFDASLPGEGLLIWRVVGNRPILEESHGIDGPMGPRVFLDSVPFPSAANRAFTPYTTPSSRSQLGGGSPVHITNIRRLPDGRITFYVGYEYY